MAQALSTKKSFTFTELPSTAQKKAVEDLRNVNVDFGWFEFIYDDAKDIGLTITSFHLYYNNIKGKLTKTLLDSCKKIRIQQDKNRDLCKTAEKYNKKYIAAFRKWLAKQHTDNYTELEMLDVFSISKTAENIETEYKQAILGNFLLRLKREYEHQTSDASVIKTINTENYTFSEDGSLID